MKTPRPNGYIDRQYAAELQDELATVNAEIRRALGKLAKDPLLAVTDLVAALDASAAAQVIGREIAEIHEHWNERLQDGD